ncbi:MAG: hypothetical protein HY821_11435 [Acidobacteria bacterium]|nr:hypothetical protein [Acidobacteriota bacterium]
MRRLAPILVLAAVSIAFYWRISLTDQYIWFDHSDMAYLELPRLQYEAREIHTGRLPMWNNGLFYGQPLIGGIQPGPLYPFNLLFCLLPLDNGFISFRLLNWYWVLIHFQAALFAFLFLKDRGIRAASALLGGFVFSYAGFMGTVPWLDVANGVLWIPLVLLFVWRAVERERTLLYSALAGLTLGIAWLSGHHELPILTSITAFATFAWFTWKSGARRLQLMAGFVIFGLTTALISAVQTLPMLEFGRLGVRWVGLPDPVGWKDVVPYTIHAIYSMTARDLLGTFILDGDLAERTFFLGLTATALAALGLLAGWKERTVRWAGAVALCALVWALGQGTFLHGLLYAAMPLADKTRVALRASALAHCAVAVMAGFGLQALIENQAAKWASRVSAVLGLVGGSILAGTLYRLSASGNPGDEGVLRAGFVALAAAAVLAAAARGAIRGSAAGAALACLVLVELSPLANFSSRFQAGGWKFASALHRNDDVGKYLRADHNPVRVITDETALPENFGEWQGLDATGGYTAGVTANIRRQEWHLPVWQNIGAVTHYVGKTPSREGQVDMFEAASGVHIWKNPGALPRTWLAHAAEQVPSVDVLREKVRQPGYQPRSRVFLLGPAPALESCAADGEYANITGRNSNSVTVEIHANCRSLLVLADTHFPGWKASIDGRPAEILEVFGGLRGVVVTPKNAAVSFRFRPASVLWGFRLTLAGLALVVLCCLPWRRRPA